MSAFLIATLISLRLTAAGVSQHQLAMPSGAPITYLNDDQAPTGPRSCHFQDLLQPSESSYSGAVNVAPASPVDDWVSANITP